MSDIMIGNHLIIKFISHRIINKKEKKINIIMEYCEGGDMKTLLKNCRRKKDYIAEDVVWKIFT